jgi:signal transduction histidine kinase
MNHKGKLKIITKHRLGYIIVDIIDNGKGIPAEVLPNIFQAFFTTKKMGEGSGLGLDICQRIISRHKGRIKAYSKPNETIFRIILPINPIVEIS